VHGHHPVFSGGRHGSTPVLVNHLKPLFERHKVGAYLNGHDHDLQHIAVDGVHHLTSGAGSETRPTGRLPNTQFAQSTLGFLDLRIDASATHGAFVSSSGDMLHAFGTPG
jgi:acid phosphatase